MRMYLLNVKNETAKTVEISDDLQEYYDVLGVRCIDIVTRKIGGKVFDIICDDEGLFDDPVKISAIDVEGKPMLVGNLLFAHHNNYGKMTGLSDEDVLHLIRNTGVVFTENFQGGYPAMGNCEYV